MCSLFKYPHDYTDRYHDVHSNINKKKTLNISKHCSKVKPEASEAELKKAYRKLAMK